MVAERAGRWREADLRGDAGPRPASVGAVVQRTRLTLAAARIAEAALLLAAACLVTLAAAIVSGAELGAEAWALAAFAGALAALSWWHEHRIDERGVARRLDQRLRHQGALATAWELERAGELPPLGRLLVGQVLARLRHREAVRALLPSLAVPVAAPLAGALLLALALERERSAGAARRGPGIEVLSAGLAGAVDGLSDDVHDAGLAGALEPHAVERALAAARRVQRIARRPAELARRPAESLAELERIDAELAALGPALQGAPELAAEFERARVWLDAARERLAPAHVPVPAGGVGADAPPGDGASGAPGAPGAAGVTDGGADGMMAGFPEPGAAAEPLGLEESPSGAARWWPPEQDGIVERWTLLRRGARARSGAPEPPPATEDR